jgi:hypothetical protein
MLSTVEASMFAGGGVVIGNAGNVAVIGRPQTKTELGVADVAGGGVAAPAALRSAVVCTRTPSPGGANF